MGHKVNPISFRLGKLQSWKSKWFARKNFAFLLEEDIKLRDFIEKKLKSAGISRVEILRSSNKATFVIKSSRPGVVIGREGAGIEELRKILKKKMQDPKIEVKLDIEEVRTPWLDASLVAQNIAEQIEKRVNFRRVMKTALRQVMEVGARGVKIMVAGRLNGADMARTEWLTEGRLPLQTLRADIDFGKEEADTKYGKIGVKVWIYKGEVFTRERKGT
ncbi:30S ribosomal protein S3 [bacterium (Candidatus Torokbacteria) CG_4_10_14_0_2_um_filter_35_8]|nr:MAG: 30S ribosomal protein S3 [bacterium (Candidatus Torokbacteria) CG_4_10_14_0_2_um_filter_35_8]